MSRTFRYFTKSQLAEANAIAIKRGYNRTLRENFVAGLSGGLMFPVVHHLVHTFKGGKPCEPHIRVVIVFDGDGDRDSFGTLDCDWKLFQKLQAVELPAIAA